MSKYLWLNILSGFGVFLFALCPGGAAFPQGFAVLADLFAGFGDPNGREDAKGNRISLSTRSG